MTVIRGLYNGVFVESENTETDINHSFFDYKIMANDHLFH